METKNQKLETGTKNQKLETGTKNQKLETGTKNQNSIVIVSDIRKMNTVPLDEKAHPFCEKVFSL